MPSRCNNLNLYVSLYDVKIPEAKIDKLKEKINPNKFDRSENNSKDFKDLNKIINHLSY